ncbi:MAG: GNAT family N-acetyltransferase [Ktedonobacteraceae bacterium]|nr:GNAT family N-acetyltransferase [Ktedonobacteraceae bacterium]
MTIDAAFTSFPTLTTGRLLLRQIRPDDVKALFAILSDEETMKYYGSAPHRSLDESSEEIKDALDHYAQRESLRWAITLRGEDTFLGSCTLFHFDEGYHRGEIGYELHRDFWGQGITSEAVAAVLTYSFSELELHRVEALIDIANERSKGLLLKLGFTYEGYLRQRYYQDGQFLDEHYFGLLRDEWQKKKREQAEDETSR